MDKKNLASPVKDNEVTLKELLEEVAMLETATNTAEKNVMVVIRRKSARRG